MMYGPMTTAQKTMLALLALVVLGGVGYMLMPPQVADEVGQKRARTVVEEFGRRLVFVSLTGEPEMVRNAIEENYRDLVTADLLETWKKAPSTAPGHFTSSPWSDRIEVSETIANEDGTVTVSGNLIEITNATTTAPQAYVVTARVQRHFSTWLISEFSGGPARN